MSFILSCKDPKDVCLAQSADESTLAVQTKAVSVVPLAVFSPRRTAERKRRRCSDPSSALFSTALPLVQCGSSSISHNPCPSPGVVPGVEFNYTTKSWCSLQTLKSRLRADISISFSLHTALCGSAEIHRTVHGVNYYSINRVQWLPSGTISLLAWVVSIIRMDRGRQIWEPGLHLLSSSLLLLIRASSQGVMPSIGSTVGLPLNR